MPKPAIIAKITAAEGKRDELVATFRRMLDHVQANEPGTEVYVLHLDAKDDNAVWFYEMYADDAALGAHSGSDMMKAVGKDLGALLAGRPEIIRVVPVGGKGLAL
jgi:quinol monooxygenase YgiN